MIWTVVVLCVVFILPSASAMMMGRRLPVGTRSVMYGAHCWWIHLWFVALGWWKLYRFRRVTCPNSGVRTGLLDPRLWLAFLVHDLGYWGKPNMDGPEGEEHPALGASVQGWTFDGHETACWRVGADGTYAEDRAEADRILARMKAGGWEGVHAWSDKLIVRRPSSRWHDFVFYHSRFLAKRDGRRFSLLCPADKMAIALTPAWLYLPMVRWTGEIHEYRKLAQGDARRGNSKGWTLLQGGESDREWYQSVRDYCRKWAVEHADGRDDTWTPAGGERVAQDGSGVWR